MCNRSDCGDPNKRTPWCGLCGDHTTETSMSLHQARNHKQDPREPAPLR